MLLTIGLACSTTPALGPGPGTGGSVSAGGTGGTVASGGSAGSGGAPIGVGGTAGGAGGSTGSSTAAGGSGGGTSTGGAATTTLVPGTELYDCSPPTGTLPPLELAEFVTELDNPIYVTHAPGEVDRLFVLEQAGKIRVVKGGTLSAAPFLDISTKVDTEGKSEESTWEQGLLGLAFHPDYATNGLFYVHYNSFGVAGHDDGAGIIAEYKVSATDPDVADPASERILFGAPTTNKYHNGGSIFFGPDKLLFIAYGDGAGDTSNPDLFPGADPNDALNRVLAQDLTSFRGKLLRIDPLVSGELGYTSPNGNIYESEPTAAPEVWSYGLRNPYRTNMDPCTGDIYIGDVGDRAWESIDIEPGLTGHFNYGWPIREGNACHKDTDPPDSCVDPERYRGPFDVHPNTDGGGPATQAVIGGSVYRGASIPALRGTYFFTDLYSPTKTLRYDRATDTLVQPVMSVETQLNPAENDQGIVAIQNGGDGELYFVSRGGSGMGLPASGVIYKLVASP